MREDNYGMYMTVKIYFEKACYLWNSISYKRKKGAFQDHAFFEASSIRKVDGKYCFVYSSEHNHDLCYAMADSPKGPFTYGGVLVDIGDLYLNGNEDETHASNYLGNPFFWTDGRLKLEEGEMTWRSG